MLILVITNTDIVQHSILSLSNDPNKSEFTY